MTPRREVKVARRRGAAARARRASRCGIVQELVDEAARTKRRCSKGGRHGQRPRRSASIRGQRSRRDASPALTFARAGRRAARRRAHRCCSSATGAAAAADEAAKLRRRRSLVAEDAGARALPRRDLRADRRQGRARRGRTVVARPRAASARISLPRVAALLDAGMASDIIGVLGPQDRSSGRCAGNAIATVEVATPIVVVTVRQTEFPPAQPARRGRHGRARSTPAPSTRAAREFVSACDGQERAARARPRPRSSSRAAAA